VFHSRLIIASSLLAVAACSAPNLDAHVAPQIGELTIILLDLPMGATARHGEAAVAVGTDGSIALIDVGNSNHDDEIRAVVRALNTDWLTPERGFSAREPLQVEWVVLTHFHGDHIGGVRDLLLADEPLRVERGVVHRGMVDIGDGVNEDDVARLQAGLTGALESRDRPLCTVAGCTLGDPLELGTATVVPLAAAGVAFDGTNNITAPAFGTSTNNEENARSVAGLISHGSFRYHFGGDLTGAGEPGVPDVESHYVQTAGPQFYGALGVDVAHAHHHARRTSSNETLVRALAPRDARSRNVVAGINPAYVGSPHDEVVERWTRDGRLGSGRFWITHRAVGGADGDAIVDAGGEVVVQTSDGGDRYEIRAANTAAMFESVRTR